MASIDPSVLHARVKRAYERGRLRWSATAGAIVLPMIALSLHAGAKPTWAIVTGTVLLVLAVGFRWYGRTWGRAVLPGLLAGSAPLLLPLLLRTGGHCCFGGACVSVCLLGCIGGGVLAGAAIGVASVGEQDRVGFLGAATLLAALTGTLGCAVVGLSGMAGMIVAVLATSMPIAAAFRVRSAS